MEYCELLSVKQVITISHMHRRNAEIWADITHLGGGGKYTV